MFEPNKIQSIKSNVKHSSLFYHPERLFLVYQMLAYNRTYQKSEGEGADIRLIYPMSENFTQIIPDFKLDNGAVIKVRPFDINRSLLI